MLEQQLAMLDTFLDRNAITKENYDKSVSALVKELKSIDSKYFLILSKTSNLIIDSCVYTMKEAKNL